MKLFTYLAPLYDLLLARVQKRQQDTIFSNIKNLKGSKLLDLGGGTGKLAGTLLQEGADVFLMDASSTMLKRACKRLPPERAVLGDAASIPFGDGTFDLVLIVDSLHHFPEQERVLQEAKRVLKNEGSLYILDFNRDHVYIRLVEKLERMLGEKSVFLTPRQLEQKLKSQGFSSIKVKELSSQEYLIAAQKT